MDKPRIRKNHNRRFDSLQYLKLAVHNSWKLTPRVAAAKNIESKNDVYKNNSSSASSPATRNSLDGVDNKIKATMANGCTFYYSVQDTVIKNDFGDEDSDDEDDEDEITDHLSKSVYEIIPGSDSLENRLSGTFTEKLDEIIIEAERNNQFHLENNNNPTTFEDFVSDLDQLRSVSALNGHLGELVSAFESRRLTISEELDLLLSNELPHIQVDDFRDTSVDIINGFVKNPIENSEQINLHVLQKSIGYESNTEYLTFNINEALDPDNNLLVESVENLDISGYSMPKTSTNDTTLQYLTLNLSDIENNAILPTSELNDAIHETSPAPNYGNNADSALLTTNSVKKDSLLSENPVDFVKSDFNEVLFDSPQKCQTHKWTSIDEFLQDFNTLTLE